MEADDIRRNQNLLPACWCCGASGLEQHRPLDVDAEEAVDPGDVRFWEGMGSMRWALGCVRRAFSFRHQDQRRLEFAGVGRRLEEPVYDILDVIEGKGP